MKNSLRIHKWTHNEFNIFILGVLTHPRKAEILSVYNIYYWNMNIYKPCYNSFCEPAATERRSKKTHGLSPMHTESLTRIFFDLCFFRCIGILNGFASVAACGWFLTTRFVEDPLTKGK